MKLLTVKTGMSQAHNTIYCIMWKRFDEMFNEIRKEKIRHSSTSIVEMMKPYAKYFNDQIWDTKERVS